RIKALEALAAKQNDGDSWNEGGFLFKERHYEKSPTDVPADFSTHFQKDATPEQDSPESPFEVLGDTKRGNEFEDTVDWMRAHLPPAPDFGSEVPDAEVGKEASDFLLSEAGPSGEVSIATTAMEVGVPDAFMDSPKGATPTTQQLHESGKEASVEEEGEFDLSFLPTAYIWEKQEKTDGEVQGPSSSAILHEQEPPAPPAGFESTPPPPSIPPVSQPVTTDIKPTPMSHNLEPAEILEVDSSGESDDTVIEDTSSIPLPVSSTSSADLSTTIPSLPAEEKEVQLTELVPPLQTQPEKQAILVPIINVIETDEQMCSDEEDEGYQVVKDPVEEAPEHPSEKSAAHADSPPEVIPGPLEIGTSEPKSQEDHSLPSAANSDPETSSQHPSINEESHADNPPTTISAGPLPKETAQDSEMSKEPDLFVRQEESLSFEELQVVNEPPAKSSLNVAESDGERITEELTDPNDSFVDISKQTQIVTSMENVDTLEVKELPKPVGGQPSPRDINQDPFSHLWSENQDTSQELIGSELKMDVSEITSLEVNGLHKESTIPNVDEIKPPTDPGTVPEVVAKQRVTKVRESSPETMSDPESIEPECSVSAATDSFVEFMRECLKSQQEEEPEDFVHHHAARDEASTIAMPHSTAPPSMVLDVEHESLTIRILKELGDSQEEEEQEKLLSSKLQTSVSPIPVTPSPPCKSPRENSASKMAEEVDMWVAEAYHLAEHVLAAILTHLSVRELVYWRDPKKSGVVFGTSLLLLLSLAAFSVISVVSYLLLALLCVTITFRIYKSVIQAVQKSNEGHPFKELMEKDVSVPPETFRKHVDVCLSYVNRALKQMSRLFLVEDLVDSLKLAVLMWLMTYVGAVFNGITILILADILLFSLPLVYEKNKTQIDHYLEIAQTQFNSIVSKLQEKLPGAVKRSKVE
ncbi:hypothetical protein JZ751_006953, partial [Albula glossodonta]